MPENVMYSVAGRMEEVLADLLPDGKISGNEYVCASLAGGEGESCSTNIATGVGADFATGEKWGDIVSLAAKVWHLPLNRAAKRLASQYGSKGARKVVLTTRKSAIRPSVKRAGSNEFSAIMPVPSSAPPPFAGQDCPSMDWCYRNAQGEAMFYIARYDKPDGSKVIRPRVYGRDSRGKDIWQWKAPPAPRPLYNLDNLARYPDRPVLIVEGEKTADKARELLPDYAVVTWSGGANAVHKTDWLPLHNREVTIFPDNDKPGLLAAETIRLKLPRAKAVTLPAYLPEKWDLADSIPDGFDLRRALEEAVAVSRVVIKDAATWISKPIPPSDPIIEGVFDVGDKCFLISGSKGRKTFFTIQAALSIASGKDFLGMHVPKARRTAIAQFEIREHHYQRRLIRMTDAMGIATTTFQGQLSILNLRGKSETLETLGVLLKEYAPQLIIIDPLYKIYPEEMDENSAGDMAALLTKVDKLAEDLGAAVMIVHHDVKAMPDARAIARGSGSGVLNRDYDSCLLLTPHATEADAFVLSTITRNYPPVANATIRWHESMFIEAKEILPKPETSTTRRAKERRGTSDEEIINIIHGWFNNSPIASMVLRDRIQKTFAIGERRAEKIVSLIVANGNYVRRRNPETRCSEIIQSYNPETSQNAELRTCPHPVHPARPINKGAGCTGNGGHRTPGTRRKLESNQTERKQL